MSEEFINNKAFRSLILLQMPLLFNSKHLEELLAERGKHSAETELKLTFCPVEKDDSKNESVKLKGHPQFLSQNQDPKSM